MVQHIQNEFSVDMLCRVCGVNGVFTVERRGGCPKLEGGDILFDTILQLFDTFGGTSCAYYHNPCGKGIQRTGMTDLQLFLLQMTADSSPHTVDHIKRRPLVWLVEV